MFLVYSEITAMVDNGLVVNMVMLDFSKALDVVSHSVLLRKVREIGGSASMLTWI